MQVFTHIDPIIYSYHSNSWLVKIASNGRYLLAPTIYGQIFAFNMLTGQVTGILKDHEGKVTLASTEVMVPHCNV